MPPERRLPSSPAGAASAPAWPASARRLAGPASPGFASQGTAASGASALWNLAYDAGYGAGPIAFGVFVAHTGYPAAFALTGLLILTALLPAVRDRAAG